MTSFRGKILVVRGGAIGDFILTLPALAALRGQFPQSWLEVLGYPHIVPLAIEGGLVNAVRSIEARALAGFFARHGELDPDLIDYFSEFDLIVSYLYDPDEIFQENVAKCITGQFIAGPHRPDEDTGVHAAKVFLQPLERLAIFEADPVPRLALAAPVRPSAQLALHPGSGSESKNWPEAKWHEFVGRLLEETPFTFLMVGGEAEGDRLQRLARELPGSRITLAQSLPLPELARRLEGCVAFVGHDSGISHLAAALGLPGVLLWGETAEEIWRPPSEKMLLIRGPTGLASLEVARVIEALQQVCAAAASKPSKSI
ncbi:MAG TPA: glycosyltransferase family 9 protein [Methylomirabilota bacterium]|nr:glycosyltransferase family 9 protein [Methylomirabilota bacterium]